MTERELTVTKIGAVVLAVFMLLTLAAAFYSFNQLQAVQGDEQIIWYLLVIMFSMGFLENTFAFSRYCRAIKNLDVSIIRKPKA